MCSSVHISISFMTTDLYSVLQLYNYLPSLLGPTPHCSNPRRFWGPPRKNLSLIRMSLFLPRAFIMPPDRDSCKDCKEKTRSRHIMQGQNIGSKIFVFFRSTEQWVLHNTIHVHGLLYPCLFSVKFQAFLLVHEVIKISKISWSGKKGTLAICPYEIDTKIDKGNFSGHGETVKYLLGQHKFELEWKN